jgi:TRAP-type C4-dicarboxylate transport system permease small subunit
MQAKWRRVFAIVLGVLIWAATFAFLEWCVFVYVIQKFWGNDLAAVLALFWCFAAFPLIAVLTMPIGLFAYTKVMPAERVRERAVAEAAHREDFQETRSSGPPSGG